MSSQTAPAPAEQVSEHPGNRLAVLRADRRLQWLAAGLLLAAGIALILWSNRGTFFYLDDWDFAILRTDLSEGSIFGPQNQNWHATTLFTYYALLKVFGFSSYVPFRLVSAALVAAISFLGYLYARRRVGPWWALALLSPLVVTAGTEIVLWPFQMGQLFSIVAGLGALVLLDREPKPGVLAAITALLLLAVVSSSAGIPMLVIVLVDRALAGGDARWGFARGGSRLALLTCLPALLLYAWWNHKWGALTPNPNGSNMGAYSAALNGAIDTGQSAVQRLLGLFNTADARHTFVGQVAFAALVVGTCERLFGPYPANRRRIAALSAGLVSYWVLLSWGRANVPGYTISPRYLYISQTLLVLLLAELGYSVLMQYRERLGWFGHRVGRAAGVVVGVGIIVTVAWSALQTSKQLRDTGYDLRVQAWAAQGQNAAVSLFPAATRGGAPFFLDPVGRQLSRPASMYFDGLKKFGTKPPTEADLKALPVEARQFADVYLLDLAAPVRAPEAGKVPIPKDGTLPPVIAPTGATPVTVTRIGSTACVRVRAASELATVTIPTTAAITITNTGPQPIFLQGHRYAPTFSPRADLPIELGQTRQLQIGPDAGTAPWAVQLRGSSSRICTVSPTATPAPAAG